MKRLEGKTAVVTGGGTGIGRGAAKRFIEEGAFVYIFGRRQEPLDAALAQLGPNARAVRGSVTDLADLDRLYEVVAKEKGGIDVLFASAGTGEFAPIGEVTEEQFDRTFGLNVRGTLFTVQKALPLFRDGGSIILNGSIAGSMGLPAFGVYSASKAALRAFVRAWLLDLKGRGIRVNVLSPGTIDTPILEGVPKAMLDEFVKMIPRGTMGRPEEIATAALFLASADSSFVNGSELFVDGGTAQV